MANSKVEAELLKALKVKKQKSGEDEQDYLGRVLKAIDDLSDDGWSDLSEPAQKWANEAAKKAKSKKDLPSFPADADEDEDEDEEEEDEKAAEDEDEEEEDEKPAKKSAKKEEKKPAKKEEKKPAKDDKKKKAKDEDEEDEDEEEDEDDAKSKKKAGKEKAKADDKGGTKRGGATGVTASIKTIMLEDPAISVEDLTKKLAKAGFETISNMTVTTVRADFRHTLKIMLAGGGLSKALAAKMSEE